MHKVFESWMVRLSDFFFYFVLYHRAHNFNVQFFFNSRTFLIFSTLSNKKEYRSNSYLVMKDIQYKLIYFWRRITFYKKYLAIGYVSLKIGTLWVDMLVTSR